MNTYEKYTKEFEIGEYKFTLGINRAIAKEVIKQSPEFTALLLEIEEYNAEHQVTNENLTKTDYVYYVLKNEELNTAASEMATVGLSKLLEYGHEGKAQPSFFEIDYKVTALKLIDFLKENGVWYDYSDEEETVSGMAKIISKFITEGFTKGKGLPMKKPTLAIKMK